MTRPERPYRWNEFDNGAALAEALATAVSVRLDDCVARTGRASIAVSGGRTPTRFFEELSMRDIAWEAITLTLVDERCVPPNSDRSNARLVMQHLLRGKAAKARFVPLYTGTGSPTDSAIAASEVLGPSVSPLDVAVLGMGADGHTASFFPDAADIEGLLSAEPGGLPVVAVEAPSAGESRLSLSMPVLAQAAYVAIHIEGAEKRAVFESAVDCGDASPPIRAFIERAERPPEVFWSP